MKVENLAVSVSYPTRCPIKVSSILLRTDERTYSSIAAAAMHAMNGAVIGTKQLVVRLHEPKQLRQEKLAARFGGNGHPRSTSGATSPTASEAGESYAGWPSPNIRTTALGGSPIATHADRVDNRARRSSGSYYHVRVIRSI